MGHVAAEGFVVAIDGGPVGGGDGPSLAGNADAGEYGGDYVIAQGE